MCYETIRVTEDNRIATVTLARPEVRNAFNETMIAELSAAFGVLDTHHGIRAVVLAAEGPSFCAGADLNWMRRMAGYGDDENRADARLLARMLEAVYRCGKPVIARVHGDAYAGGVGLVAACDIAIAAQPARFCLSEARLGLIPATIAPYVVRALGERASRRYFTTAEVFGSQRATQLGLIHDAVPAESLDAAIAQLADALRANGPAAVRAGKRLVGEVAGRVLDDALIEYTADRIAETRAGAEAREGIAAFLDKRAPAWRE